MPLSICALCFKELDSIKNGLPLFPFHRWENWGTKIYLARKKRSPTWSRPEFRILSNMTDDLYPTIFIPTHLTRFLASMDIYIDRRMDPKVLEEISNTVKIKTTVNGTSRLWQTLHVCNSQLPWIFILQMENCVSEGAGSMLDRSWVRFELPKSKDHWLSITPCYLLTTEVCQVSELWRASGGVCIAFA